MSVLRTAWTVPGKGSTVGELLGWIAKHGYQDIGKIPDGWAVKVGVRTDLGILNQDEAPDAYDITRVMEAIRRAEVGVAKKAPKLCLICGRRKSWHHEFEEENEDAAEAEEKER